MAEFSESKSESSACSSSSGVSVTYEEQTDTHNNTNTELVIEPWVGQKWRPWAAPVLGLVKYSFWIATLGTHRNQARKSSVLGNRDCKQPGRQRQPERRLYDTTEYSLPQVTFTCS